MSEYKIESGIPLPGRRLKYPFAEMKVGDSFAIAEADLRKISVSAFAEGKRLGFKFSVRTADGGGRVWRIA